MLASIILTLNHILVGMWVILIALSVLFDMLTTCTTSPICIPL